MGPQPQTVRHFSHLPHNITQTNFHANLFQSNIMEVKPKKIKMEKIETTKIKIKSLQYYSKVGYLVTTCVPLSNLFFKKYTTFDNFLFDIFQVKSLYFGTIEYIRQGM